MTSLSVMLRWPPRTSLMDWAALNGLPLTDQLWQPAT